MLPRAHPARTPAIAVAALLSLLTAAPAQAALEWHPGSIEQSYVGNCNFDSETGIIANAEFQSDPVQIPRTGDVFYVRTIPGRVGNGCGIGMAAHVEIVLPPGVTTAVSSAHPVRCNSMDIDTGALTPAAGCPQAAQQGVYGLAFDQQAAAGSISPWELAYGQALIIEIPLRASRRLAGTSPSCGRAEGQPPCAGDRSGDTVQFAEKIIDGWASPWLSPYVALFVQDAGAGGGGGRGGLIASAPRSVRIARLLHGVLITVRVARGGSRVTAQLSTRGLRGFAAARSRLIATKTVRGARSGRLKLRLKPSRKVGHVLRHVRRLSTTLSVRVTPPGGRAETARTHILLKH